MSINDNMTTLIKTILENRLFDFHTCLPAKINSYDEKKHKAEVQPILKRILTTDEVLETPVIANVPVIFPRSKNFIMHYPLEKDDRVLLVFAERSLDNYLTDGSESPPLDGKKFDLTDAVAIPGFFPFNESSSVENNKDFVINFKDKKFKISDSGAIEITDGTATMKIDTGKIAFGTKANELLDLLDQTLDSLTKTTVATAIGPQPLSTIIDFGLIKTKLNTIKGSL